MLLNVPHTCTQVLNFRGKSPTTPEGTVEPSQILSE